MSICTREVKSVVEFSVHGIIFLVYLGLLHKIQNVYKHSKVTVYIVQKADFKKSYTQSLPIKNTLIKDGLDKKPKECTLAIVEIVKKRPVKIYLYTSSVDFARFQ